ncbi:ribbon-helix-helix domain-containing protein [Mycobacterium paraffinicum]|uniref:Ribbon-helix-helix protein CopG domain-containing protein n=1 Tax=Mycobacterium paraffinicum TaxID=53378 RepID=A0ABP8F7Y5_9MYCO|nr:ribbon-helix-helix domain-containing protein [Mycobacterium paraffinicum]MCV7313736.1 CopG family transcriptional regulator [Mycobacterium paraffinicum]
MTDEHREHRDDGDDQKPDRTPARTRIPNKGVVAYPATISAAQAREDEKRRREAAQAGDAEVEPGGHEVAPRSIKQMVSVRLEAHLLKELRQLAERQGASVSELLRQAAIDLVLRSHHGGPVMAMTFKSSESAGVITELTAGPRLTSGVYLAGDTSQMVFSSGDEAQLCATS